MQALFDPANSAAVGGWGLILTIVGFAVSIWQLVRVRRVASAARDAVTSVQVRISRYEAAVDLAEAKASLQNARHYANLEAWPQFVASYEIVSEALGRLVVEGLDIDPIVSDALKRMRNRVVKTCNAVEKHIEGTAPAPIISNLKKNIRSELHIIQEAEQKNWKGAIS